MQTRYCPRGEAEIWLSASRELRSYSPVHGCWTLWLTDGAHLASKPAFPCLTCWNMKRMSRRAHHGVGRATIQHLPCFPMRIPSRAVSQRRRATSDPSPSVDADHNQTFPHTAPPSPSSPMTTAHCTHTRSLYSIPISRMVSRERGVDLWTRADASCTP
ncbi:hypothetical protein BD626DRAFT_267194 [Schizophyllum amplum]|uniref:Uncharacterized protein n=1 Tax=Schizophyllum amplum TaxID=97359 RepID=A0A550BSR0_9AGAR|nr:hypothetical protein BD626DRAFT_48373 [Auriculariopsis ampla]TRM56126.1 hypothetical protein BD626DRAFT_267194 [Auriculariopsis ampla]